MIGKFSIIWTRKEFTRKRVNEAKYLQGRWKRMGEFLGARPVAGGTRSVRRTTSPTSAGRRRKTREVAERVTGHVTEQHTVLAWPAPWRHAHVSHSVVTGEVAPFPPTPCVFSVASKPGTTVTANCRKLATVHRSSDRSP